MSLSAENLYHYRPTLPTLEDTFTFPEELKNSKKIKYALEVVTNKYLFYLQAAASSWRFSEIPDALEGVYDKVTHSNDVIKAAIETWKPGHRVSLEDVVVAAIYHDLFRSLQGFFFLDYRDGKIGYLHGEEAARYIVLTVPEEYILKPYSKALQSPPDLWDLNEEERKNLKKKQMRRKRRSPIVRAVESHSKLNPLDDKYLTLLLRDIDKIAIIRRITEIQERLERTRTGVLESGLSEEVKATFKRQSDIPRYVLNPEIEPYLKRRVLVNGALRKTKMDELVYHLAWIWDLNTQKAREIFAQDRLPEKIILYIERELIPTPDDIENPEELVTARALVNESVKKLKANVAAWYAEFNLGEPNYF